MDRVLLVEDDPALMRGLSDNLRSQAFEVMTATDGQAAYHLINTAAPDLILLDLTLPGLDGLEICRRVREDGLRMPIVMLTARGDEYDRVRGLELGADDYISKPFSLPELFARIHGLLRHRRAWLTETRELQHDLRKASDVQRGLFPRHVPAIVGLDCAGACRPARIVGGDYFDYFNVGDARLALVVADVAGKGASAALLMASLQGCVRSSAPSLGHACSLVAEHVNHRLLATTDAARYATMIYGVFDAPSGVLTYVNAGHVAAYVVGGRHTIELPSHAPPVGLFETLPLIDQTVTVERGAWLVLISDGISEAVNAQDVEFGRDRLLDVVHARREAGAADMCDAILNAVAAHADGQSQGDDLTVVAVKRT